MRVRVSWQLELSGLCLEELALILHLIRRELYWTRIDLRIRALLVLDQALIVFRVHELLCIALLGLLFSLLLHRPHIE